MEKLTVKKVETRREMNDFIALPHRLYKGCPHYVPDLDYEVRETFSPRSPGLQHADIQAFVAYRGAECVGRVAGIVNRRANKKWQTKNVRFGWIEFVDDREVSAALLAAVEAWGVERGMDRAQGPLGIFDFDKEGMLVEDFDQDGSPITIYNPPYYPQHLEALGYRKEVDWVQIRGEVPQEVPAKYARVAAYVRETLGLHIYKMRRADMHNGYCQKVFAVLNAAFAPLFGFSELTPQQVDQFVDRYFPIIDKQFVPVIENAEGEVVGVAVTMASLSDALRRTRGQLFPFGWWRILAGMKWRRSDMAEMLLIGIKPELQGLGVNAMFFDDLIPIYNRAGITRFETGPQLEDNVRELSQWKLLKPQLVKRRRCYTRELRIKS